jgi:energy-coupling factor transport system substrate-specific component
MAKHETADPFRERKERSFVERIRDDFTTVAWVLIPVAVGINVIGGTLTNVLRIPLFLDVIGTILLAILAGPWVAVVGGALTNVVLSFTASPTLLPFALVQIAIGLVVGYFALKGWFRVTEAVGYWKLLVVALAVMATAVVVSAPIVVLVFGGVTGGPTSVITGFFLATGQELLTSVLATQFITEPIDKIVSVAVAYAIATSVPERYRPSFGQRALE